MASLHIMEPHSRSTGMRIQMVRGPSKDIKDIGKILMANLGDFLKTINSEKVNLIDEDPNAEKEYLPFIVNRTLSYQPDCIPWVHEMNQRPFADNKMQFDYLLNSIRKKKRFAKWVKPEKNANLELVKKFYGYNNKKAMEALTILSDDQLKSMRKSMATGGIKKK